MAQAYWESAALMAAVELEVFTAIAHGHDTDPGGRPGRRHQRAQRRAAADGAHRHDPARRATTASALRQRARRAALPGQGRRALCRAVDPVHQAALGGVRRARRAPAPARGEPSRPYDEFTVDDARRYHAATYSIGMGAARLFSRSVDLTGRKLMLDLGGGSGAYSDRGDQDLSRPEGDRARPAAGRGGGRASTSPPTTRPTG